MLIDFCVRSCSVIRLGKAVEMRIALGSNTLTFLDDLEDSRIFDFCFTLCFQHNMYSQIKDSFRLIIPY